MVFLDHKKLDLTSPHLTMSSESALQRASSRKVTWYSLAALALAAFAALNRERAFMTNYTAQQEGVIDATVGELGGSSTIKPKPIRQISILGERNSGTRWTYGHLSMCFNHTLPVKRDLTRYKHWFQYRNVTKYKHDTLVIAQFRNPYDWLEAMRNVPHHCPAHMFMHWSEFLSKPWTTERIGLDLEITDDNALCQMDFRFNEIVSCNYEPLPHEAYEHKLRYSEHQPFYELRQDGSGLPFANIMEMRAAKIRNFLEVKDYVGVADVWTAQYEYLLAKGTKGMLDKISEWTGVPYKCDPFPPQNRRKRKLSKRFAKYVNENLDWTAEGLIGYTQELIEEAKDHFEEEHAENMEENNEDEDENE